MEHSERDTCVPVVSLGQGEYRKDWPPAQVNKDDRDACERAIRQRLNSCRHAMTDLACDMYAAPRRPDAMRRAAQRLRHAAEMIELEAERLAVVLRRMEDAA